MSKFELASGAPCLYTPTVARTKADGSGKGNDFCPLLPREPMRAREIGQKNQNALENWASCTTTPMKMGKKCYIDPPYIVSLKPPFRENSSSSAFRYM